VVATLALVIHAAQVLAVMVGPASNAWRRQE
jgi:hypothetical protein